MNATQTALTTPELAAKLGVSLNHIGAWRCNQNMPGVIGKKPRPGRGKPTLLWDWDLVERWLTETGRWDGEKLVRKKQEKPIGEDARAWARRMGFSLFDE